MKNTATISDRSPRYGEWLAVFGTNEVPIINIVFPNKANVLGEIRDVYMLDLDKLTPEQMGRLKGHIASKFGIPLAEDLFITTDQMFFL